MFHFVLCSRALGSHLGEWCMLVFIPWTFAEPPFCAGPFWQGSSLPRGRGRLPGETEIYGEVGLTLIIDGGRTFWIKRSSPSRLKRNHSRRGTCSISPGQSQGQEREWEGWRAWQPHGLKTNENTGATLPSPTVTTPSHAGYLWAPALGLKG